MTRNVGLIGLGIGSVVSFATLVGCAAHTFRVVEKTSGAGVVAIATAQDQAREQAESYMKSQCPAGYDVQKEAEAVIGETTKGKQQATWYGGSSSSSTTTQKTEWRIEYKCKDASGAAPAPAAPAAAPAAGGKTSSETHVLIVRY
jgi:hypothetical protein